MKFNLNKFIEMIPDKGIQDYILEDLYDPYDEEDPFDNRNNFFLVFNNIINLAFIYAFSCVKTLANQYDESKKQSCLDSLTERGNSNSKRVIRTLQHVYQKHEITNEMIQFVLTDIYFDFALGDSSVLKSVIPFCFSGYSSIYLDEYFSVMKMLPYIDRRSKETSARKKYTFETVITMLYNLINIFDFLKYCKLSFDEKLGWYVFTYNDKIPQYKFTKINTFGLIKRVEINNNMRYCYISSIDGNGNIIYSTPDGKRSVLCTATENGKEDLPIDGVKRPFILSEDKETLLSYLQPELLDTHVDQTHSSINQVFTINYKYLRSLSLAISDVIGLDEYFSCQEQLAMKYKDIHKDIWISSDDKERNWDVILLMLLMEETPSGVLFTIINSNSSAGYRILCNLKKRLGRYFSRHVLDITNNVQFLEKAKERIDYSSASMIPKGLFDEFERKALVYSQVMIILELLSNSNQNDEKITYNMVIRHSEYMRSLHKTAQSEKLNYLNIIIRNLLVRLICFYNGVIGCAEYKMNYSRESEHMNFSDKEVAQWQTTIERNFLRSAKKTYHTIMNRKQHELSLYDLTKMFLSLCNAKVYDNESSYKKYVGIKEVLGRRYILDVDDFVRNSEINNLPELNEDTVDEWLRIAEKALYYMKTGNSERDKSCDFLNTVFPISATYSKRNDNHDGYKTAVFTLEIDADNNGKIDYQQNVNILSEFEYEMSRKYYCLPNIERSTTEWWIDPLIISCREFDAIFEEGE